MSHGHVRQREKLDTMQCVYRNRQICPFSPFLVEQCVSEGGGGHPDMGAELVFTKPACAKRRFFSNAFHRCIFLQLPDFYRTDLSIITVKTVGGFSLHWICCGRPFPPHTPPDTKYFDLVLGYTSATTCKHMCNTQSKIKDQIITEIYKNRWILLFKRISFCRKIDLF